jgi:ABC-type multidrug transport system fused ATPase/permease subunit
MIEVALASWLLYNKVGAAFAAPIVIVILSFIVLSTIVQYTGNAQRMWMAGVQKRVGLTATVIASMKNIKVSGLASPISDFIQNLRVNELMAGSRLRKLNLLTTALAFGPVFISPVMTYAIARRTLDANTLFTSLSYLVLLTTPLTNIIKTVQLVMSGLACLGRIQAFLESTPREDFRVVLPTAKPNFEKVLIETGLAAERPDGILSSSAITVSDGSFGWEDDIAVLHNVNIHIPKSSLTIVVGPIASGKSTLCKALLGETPFSRGSVTINTNIERVAYCDESPFLSNSSIRSNILGYSAFNPERYADIIEATMLTSDFETLPQGDETIVGSNGITLSGGQKQRISLARALYLESDLLILDDIFSGLDAETEEHVFRRVFGPGGIIQRRQATAMLCTHSVRHLPSAQNIIVLGTEGSVLEQGSFEELVANEKYVHSLGVSTSESDTDIDSSRSTDSGGDIGPAVAGRLPALPHLVVPKAPATARQLGDWTVYKLYFRSMGLVLTGSMFWCAALYGFFFNFPTIWLKYWSDDAFTEHPKHSYSYYVGIYALLQTCCLLSLVALGYLIWVTGIRKSGANLHRDALRTLIRAPLRFFTTTDQGIITNLFSQDLNLVDTELPNALLNSLINLTPAIGQAAVMVTASPYVAISYPFLLGLMWFIQKFYLRTSRQLRILDLETKSPL